MNLIKFIESLSDIPLDFYTLVQYFLMRSYWSYQDLKFPIQKKTNVIEVYIN